MKISNMKLEEKSNIYIDMSADNDDLLMMITSLLLRVDDSLDKGELRILCHNLNNYLNKKLILDHIFWHRSSKVGDLDKHEIAFTKSLIEANFD